MQFLVIVFLFGSLVPIHSVRVELNQVLKNVNNIMTTYNKELDTVVPFKELRASLVVLDSLAKNYHGDSRADIAAASALGYKAASKYYTAIETVFRWCAKAEMYCRCIILKDSAGNHVSSDNPLYVISALLMTGLKEVAQSIALLESVRNTLTEMQSRLRPVPSKLNSELEDIRWEYTRQRQDRQRAVDQENERRTAEMAIKTSSSLALGLLGGPIGAILGLSLSLSNVGISQAVLDQHEEATKSQQLQITETFLKSLIKAVESTIDTISNVKGEIHKEITNVKALQGSMDGHITLVVEMEDFPDDELKQLKESVHEFIARHGGGPHRSRERRDIATQGRQTITWQEMSNAVDEYMNATAIQREIEYWMFPENEYSHRHLFVT